jgi:hypothetical protein
MVEAFQTLRRYQNRIDRVVTLPGSRTLPNTGSARILMTARLALRLQVTTRRVTRSRTQPARFKPAVTNGGVPRWGASNVTVSFELPVRSPRLLLRLEYFLCVMKLLANLYAHYRVLCW